MRKLFYGARVGILGAGRSGVAAARLLKKLGAQVLISDAHKIADKLPASIHVETGRHSGRLLKCQWLIRSPGVPDDLPILRKARQKRIPIWSELELASRFIPQALVVAITGTNGKTTTTALTGEIFKSAGRATVMAGNIGTPLSARAGRVKKNSALVLEVSSYQLENIQTFHPAVSAVLNISPDHLEHHRTLRAYVGAKARIFENQTRQDVCVLNADDPACRRLARQCPAQVLFFSRKKALRRGVYYQHGRIGVRWPGRSGHFPLRWRLPGPHNVENALAAAAIAVASGIPLLRIRQALARFKGVEHRLEWVRTLRGVRYINDSKATNVDSTRVALESFKDPVILIMGGRGKGVPYTPLRSVLKKHGRRLLLIGEEAGRIERDLAPAASCERVGSMDRAVAHASEIARAGDVVLLSPACASFDQYKDFEERGRTFKRLVRRLS